MHFKELMVFVGCFTTALERKTALAFAGFSVLGAMKKSFPQKM